MNRHVSLVTGAGGLLGAAIAEALAARGAILVLTDARAVALEAVTERIRPSVAAALVADLGEERGAKEAVQATVGAAGRIDSCNNAVGTEGPIGPAEQLDVQEIIEVFRVNVFALFHVLRSVLPVLKIQRSGRIINLASGAGLTGTALMSPYSSSKHAVVGLTRSVALEAAEHGIAVNAVCPGCVESPMMERVEAGLGRVTGSAASFEPLIPVGRYARPEEVAGLATYLALDAPCYLTGAALVIDGALRA
jgi:NAD(P)-dependent dehydrogenase (short-subunit alcohol dehydrogenase family)